MFICVNTHTHTHIKNTYIYKDAATKGLRGQLTPKGHSKTQILELQKSHSIKTIFTIKTTTAT